MAEGPVELLKLNDVTKKFGGLTAVSKYCLTIDKGQIVGLIGPNGAGKTTIFNIITGVYTPTEGQVVFRGESLAGLKPYQIVQRGIARTFQNLRLFRNLTVLENVLAAAQLEMKYGFLSMVFRTPDFRRQEKAARAKALRLLEMLGLDQKAKEKAKNLPYGYQRKVEIARALATEPKLLLLDEPAAGMNPDESLDLMEFIGRIRFQFDLTVLLIEHHMEVVMGVCDKISVLNFGCPIAEGTPDQIQAHPEVIKAYLGEVEENAAG